MRGDSPLLELRSVVCSLGLRLVSSEGSLLDGGVRERFYIANADGSPLTPKRLDQIHAHVCQTFAPDLTFPPGHSVQVLASA